VKISSLLLLIPVLLAGAPAQAQQARAGQVGLLVVAHGAGEDWNRPVREIASAAAAGAPVEVSFLMGPEAPSARFQDAVQRLVDRGSTRVVVVPLLASSHSGHYEQIRYLTGQTDALDETMQHHLHMSGITRPTARVPLTLTPAIDASMEIARVLADRARALAPQPAGRALFIIAHGPNTAEEHAEWMANLRPVADSVARLTGFRDVKIGLVRDDADPPVRAEAVRGIREIIDLQHQLTGAPVVVVPLLVSKSPINYDKFPTDLAGLVIAYDGEGLLPHAGVADWIRRRVREGSAAVLP
jgi:sirohydrochlorin cobaltochelatase